MTIRTLLVDDEPLAIKGLRQVLEPENDIEIIDTCTDGAAAIAAITEQPIDLVFLDIQMPELTGFDVIDAIGLEKMPPVVFVTAYDHFATKAFDVHAVDYVLKPIDPDRLKLALQRVRSRQLKKDINPTVDSSPHIELSRALNELNKQAPHRWAKRLAIKTSGRVLLIDVNEIDKFTADGNYVEVHAGVKVHLLRETLTNLEIRLDPGSFARISRSAIVNIDRIKEIQGMFNGDFMVILQDGSEINGSRRYRAALDAILL